MKFTFKFIRLVGHVLSIGGIAIFSSCQNAESNDNIFSNVAELFSSDVSSEQIQSTLNQLNINDSSSNNNATNLKNEIKKIYESNGFKPLWIKNGSFSDRGKNAIDAISNLDLDGLNPEKYSFQYFNHLKNEKELKNDSLAWIDVALTQQMALAANDLTFGILNPSEVDKEWHSANDTTFSLSAFIESDSSSNNSKNILDHFRPLNPRYALMLKEMDKWKQLKNDTVYLKAKSLIGTKTDEHLTTIIQKEISSSSSDTSLIKEYQYLNHISVTGKITDELLAVLKKTPDTYITQLKSNLERMRWLPNSFDAQYIWVSIPQAEVDYYKDGNNLFHNRTIVGSKTNRTPSITKPLQNIVICPPWNLPFSIVGKEYGGRIPARYQVFKGGKRVPNSAVNATNYKQYSVRQPPGPSAALGYVKFNLPNQWDIYLHDTPNRSLFGNKLRYMSHGCVRVKDPRKLASLLLENKGVGVDSINKIIQTNKTTFINTSKIPVYINYFTANADSAMNNMLYLNDPYKKDSAIVSKLVAIK